MLLHQFIIMLSAWAKRFDALLLKSVTIARRVLSRAKLDGSDLQET